MSLTGGDPVLFTAASERAHTQSHGSGLVAEGASVSRSALSGAAVGHEGAR